jgi:rod shape-determining protein MreC
MANPSRRRLLVILVLATCAVLLADLAGGPGPVVLRSAAGGVFGPLERLVSPSTDGRRAEAARRSTASDTAVSQRAGGHQLAALAVAPETRQKTFIAARVVAAGRQGPRGPERVTIDAGSRDGVQRDLAVVNADGLVGRVVGVSPWTADVLLVGAEDLTVAVRVGAAGTLGSVSGAATVTCPPTDGDVALDVVQRGRVEKGAVVTTMGSVGGTPFPPGLRVGTVSAVSAPPGQLVPSACLTPAVDLTTLDVVGVLPRSPRSTPRVPTTGGS